MKYPFHIILLMGIFSSLFGCRNSNEQTDKSVFPAEQFAILEARNSDNQPIIGSINTAYKDFDKKGEYPWCLKLAIALNLENLYENGLPKNEESDIANRFEDQLLEAIGKRATAHYVGHIYNDTFLDVYVYLDNPEKVHHYLQSLIEDDNNIRGFGYEINKDPDWETVSEFLQ